MINIESTPAGTIVGFENSLPVSGALWTLQVFADCFIHQGQPRPGQEKGIWPLSIFYLIPSRSGVRCRYPIGSGKHSAPPQLPLFFPRQSSITPPSSTISSPRLQASWYDAISQKDRMSARHGCRSILVVYALGHSTYLQSTGYWVLGTYLVPIYYLSMLWIGSC